MDPGAHFRDLLGEAGAVIAPELIVAEICNAFRKYVRARRLSYAEAERFIDEALALVDSLHSMREFVPEVVALASRIDSSMCDLFYLALARRAGAILLTADGALSKAASALGIQSPG